MKINEYKVLLEQIENGTKSGYRKAHKHIENPTEEQLTQCIIDHIELCISEYFTFEAQP